MSNLAKVGLFMALTAAPTALVEHAKLCARPPTMEESFPIALPRGVGMHWLDRKQCRFLRVSEPDAGVLLSESGRVTEPVKTKNGWELGECITGRRLQTTSSTIETSFRCDAPNRRLREVEMLAGGTVTTRLFNKDSGALEQRFTDLVLFDGERALRCERFSPDGGVAELIEYGVRTADWCVPLGSPNAPRPSMQFEYDRRR